MTFSPASAQRPFDGRREQDLIPHPSNSSQGPPGSQKNAKDASTMTKDGPAIKSWAHFVAGGAGGMTAAILTSPLDVLKTRLQSDVYQAHLRAVNADRPPLPRATLLNIPASGLRHLRETGQVLGQLYTHEGFRALFKGLGASLVGVVPARSINFFVYGNGKRMLNEHFNPEHKENVWWIHLAAAATAGIATGTVTNPIWLVKTRMQLDKNRASDDPRRGRLYRNSWDCIKQTVRHEGIRGLYKGLTASYLGVSESTLHWVLYERMKLSLARREVIRSDTPGYKRTWTDEAEEYGGKFTAACCAKFIASIITYPHEVARTRLRQAPMVTTGSGEATVKYTGLVQCFRLVAKEEGLAGMYGGMTPHLLRTVPSAGIMFGMYEIILTLLGEKS